MRYRRSTSVCSCAAACRPLSVRRASSVGAGTRPRCCSAMARKIDWSVSTPSRRWGDGGGGPPPLPRDLPIAARRNATPRAARRSHGTARSPLPIRSRATVQFTSRHASWLESQSILRLQLLCGALVRGKVDALSRYHLHNVSRNSPQRASCCCRGCSQGLRSDGGRGVRGPAARARAW